MNTSVTEKPADTEDALRNAYGQWKKAVEAELKGAPFDKKLVSRTPEGIAIQPVYTRLDGAVPYAFKPRSYVDAPWDFAQEVGSSSPEEFNRRLIADLGKGLNSLAIDFTSETGRGLGLKSRRDWETALAGVEFGCIPLYLKTGESASTLGALLVSVASARGIAPAALKGCVAADPLGSYAANGVASDSLEHLFDDLAGWTTWAKENAPELATVSVDASVWAEAGGTAVQELAFALAAASEYLYELSSRGLSAATVAKRIRFRFAVGGQFFKEIAKFRALRPLWARVLRAYGIEADEAPLKIDARTARSNKTLLDPYTNMLRVTTEAASAVLGGVDALTISAFNEVAGGSDDFARRIARNLHTLLAEEFQLIAPADPARGSWYVEKLTDELARGAWALFQDIEKRGGLRRALESGHVQSLIAKAAKDAQEGFDSRRQVLVGTNLYPNIKDTLAVKTAAENVALVPASEPEWAREIHGLPTLQARFAASLSRLTPSTTEKEIFGLLHRTAIEAPRITAVRAQRLAEGFEGLRLISQERLAKTGRRPRVYLAKIGPALQHKARADFAAGFFGTGGFELLSKEAWATAEEAAAGAIASGAEAVVLCSTDETYPELVPVFAGAVKKASPNTVVVLAGYPTEHIAGFQQAGVDSFIHLRANVRETLERIINGAAVKA